MLLNNDQIKKIIYKTPKKLKNKHTNQEINEYNFEQWEMLSLIQTYIKEIKGIDVRAIQAPKGEYCPSFIQFIVSKSNNPMLGMNKGNDFTCMDYCFYISFNYFINKFKENEV